MKFDKFSSLQKLPLIPIAFSICFLYWMYIASIAEMVIAHDSIGYEKFGRLLSEKGWVEYWRTGPYREPLYPFLISWSMKLGQKLSISYQTIQMFLQFIFLFTTQCLMLNILRRLKINPVLCAVMILYYGVSPSIINATIILYSEIASFPFILITLILNIGLWKTLTTANFDNPYLRNKALSYSLGLGFSYALLTFARAIFETLTPFLFLPYVILFFHSLNKKRSIQQKFIIGTVLVSLTTFYAPILSFKLMNKRYNGHFTLMEHGARALYGNTARRMMELTPKKFMAAAAFVPSWRFCLEHFSTQECEQWSFLASDDLGVKKRMELEKTLPPGKVAGALLSLSAQEVLKNPLQYMLLMGVESLKMCFWEAASSQYVILPKKIIQFYSIKFFSRGLEWIGAFFSLITIIYLGIIAWRNRKDILDPSDKNSTQTLFLIFIFLYSFIFFHSFFYILPRYILPIASLYLIIFAHLIQNVGMILFASKYKK